VWSSVSEQRRPGRYVTFPGYRAGMKPANFGQKYPAEVLTKGEVWGLLAACSRRAPTGIRNAALIVVMWRAGLRVSEALALRVADVDVEHGTLSVMHGKGDRRRVVGIDPQALAMMQRWLDCRRRIGLAHARPIFCTISGETRGKQLKDSYVREALKKLGKKAGIEKRVHPHGLRHTHASELAREGVPVHIIRRQLGHSSLAVTANYIDHLTPMDVIAAMQEREWVTALAPELAPLKEREWVTGLAPELAPRPPSA
jgi:site-specific recombinase XerD